MVRHRLPLAPLLVSFTSLLTLVAPGAASAANPVLRHQEDLHGDVVVFGSTLGFDCGAGIAAPAGAIASCAGQLNVAEGAPDLYWRDDKADATITSTQARTSATLVLPAGATITYARLYWAALTSGPTQVPDTNATLDWLGGPQQTIVADTTWVLPYAFPASHPDWYYYQASGDATDFVSTWGAGDFRVSDVQALTLANINVDRAFSAWTLVVFYENPGDDLRNLALFDSLTPIDPMGGISSAEVTLSGFLVPPGFTARMSAFTYEGDFGYTGDHFTVNGQQLTNAQNPADNFFNSSRTNLGVPVSGPLDVPQLSGVAGSMAGYDLDTADVTAFLKPGDTSCKVGADSTYDAFYLGGFVTSVASLAPDFHGMTKVAVDLNGGALVTGDVVEYTITATNSGNDAAVGAVMTDVLATGLTLVPGSIEIVQGGAVGLKTSAAGDDQGDYAAGTRTITWRVGAGADAVSGGTVDVAEDVVVRFRATVTAQSGAVDNQGLLTASGEAGAPEKTWLSDGDPLTLGDQPTTVVVYECDADAQCSGTKPHCDPTTHVCTGCATDADCTDPQHPACEPSGACGQCSATNASLCSGSTPVCDALSGTCVLCTLGSMGDAQQCKDDPAGPVCVAGAGGTVHCGCVVDGDCGDPMSGTVCDSVLGKCEPGCRGMGGNGCPTGQKCTSKDTSVGMCVPDSGTGGAGGAGGGSGAGGNGTGGQVVGDVGRCGCEVPGGSEGGQGAAAAALLGLAAVVRRRRRG